MTYCCADIHGEYELFMKLLDRIAFSEQDEMIICGDIIDKGMGSIQLLKLISTNKNFTFIMGNHEYDFLKLYHSLMQREQTDYDNILKQLQTGFPDGTLLNWETMDWLENQSFYLERENYICVHSGIPVLKNNTLQDLRKTTAEEFVYDRRFKNADVLPDTKKCVFFGHTPSNYLMGRHEIITYSKTQNPHSLSDFIKIHLDIGSWLGGGVGCFCINNLTAYYIRP